MIKHICEHCGRERLVGAANYTCICTRKGRPQKQSVLPCIHRGIVVDQRKLGCCGFTKVYECKMGGQCVIKKSARATERDTEGLVFCDECEFREA